MVYKPYAPNRGALNTHGVGPEYNDIHGVGYEDNGIHVKLIRFIATEECTWKRNGCLHCCLPGNLLELVASLCHYPTLKKWRKWAIGKVGLLRC